MTVGGYKKLQERNFKMKKLIALILATVMLLALCACGGSGKNSVSGNVSYDIPEGKVIPDDGVVDITIQSHASWPYEEDWKVWQYIKEAIGGTVNVNAIPATEFGTKFPLIMAAPDELPDLINFQTKNASIPNYCAQGAFLAYDDYLEYLPDYEAFWESVPEDEKWMRDVRKSIDGKVYYSPSHGLERSTNIRAWLYRKDVFEKHNLKAPETMEELYTVCKKLKELYPESYPFAIRSVMSNLSVIGSSWKPNFHVGTYYDFENEKWSFGATEDVMYDVVEFFNRMVSEKLTPADCFNMNTSAWQELVSTDRGFIMPEYQVRIDFFNNIARAANPEFTIAACLPPRADNGTGVNMLNKYNFVPSGYVVCNTGNEGDIANAFRVINWFYTDEATELVSWGKEGETYEIVDGKKQFITTEEDDNVQTLYGFNTLGTHIRHAPDSIDASISEEQASVTDFLLENTYPHLDPTLYLEFASEESEALADLNTSISTFVNENIQKFIIGQKPLSEWDVFKKELSELPVNELLAIYEEAYNRVK